MVNFNVRFPEDLHARIRAQAAADRRSINSEILHLLEIGLATERGSTGPLRDPADPAPPHAKPDTSPI